MELIRETRNTPLWDTAAAATALCSHGSQGADDSPHQLEILAARSLTNQGSADKPSQEEWPIALQIVAGRAVSLVGEPPTETYRPDEWSGANREWAHRDICKPALGVRRLRTAPDGWNCCCNCCCHGEMRCGVDTSAGQPCATAPRK